MKFSINISIRQSGNKKQAHVRSENVILQGQKSSSNYLSTLGRFNRAMHDGKIWIRKWFFKNQNRFSICSRSATLQNKGFNFKWSSLIIAARMLNVPIKSARTTSKPKKTCAHDSTNYSIITISTNLCWFK